MLGSVKSLLFVIINLLLTFLISKEYALYKIRSDRADRPDDCPLC